MAKSLEELTAAELFELAQRRQQEEKERQREAVKEQVESLRAKRRDAVARHKKELAAIDAEIRALAGGAARAPRTRGKVNVSQKVLEIIDAKGTASTGDIKKALEDEGVAVGNLSQTLAYLKRMGRVVSAGRANYKLA